MKRLAVARFYFEGNAFSPEPTTLESCLQQQWQSGDQALSSARDSATELAAVAEFAETHPDWELTLLRCASALAAGPLDDALFARILTEICTPLAGSRWDAVYICLHGAAITAERTSSDVDLLRAVRDAIGATPLAASFALNANMHPDMAGLLDFATGARSSAAADLRDTAARTLRQLALIAENQARPHCVIASTGMVLSGVNIDSASEPMAGLLHAAREAEHKGIVDISLFTGFPYADSPQCAAKVMVWAADAPAARLAADAIAATWQTQKQHLRGVLPGPNVALTRAMAAPDGLIAITDPADDPGSGGAADSTTLFRALLESWRGGPAVFAFFADQALVERAQQAGAGTVFQADIGARTSRDYGARVQVRAQVQKLCDGRFRNRGPLAFGQERDIGPSAVLAVDGIKIIITSRRVQADDPAFFDLHGIDLAGTRLLCIKGKSRFRAAFEPLCRQIIDCDAPGPAAADLRSLPFRNVRMR